MVPQAGQDRNYIIADLLAFQQPLAIQVANVDRPVTEPHIRPAQFAFHAKRRASPPVEHDLAREFSEPPQHAETVFGHPQGHGGALPLCSSQVAEAGFAGLTRQIHYGFCTLGSSTSNQFSTAAPANLRTQVWRILRNSSFKATFVFLHQPAL